MYRSRRLCGFRFRRQIACRCLALKPKREDVCRWLGVSCLKMAVRATEYVCQACRQVEEHPSSEVVNEISLTFILEQYGIICCKLLSSDKQGSGYCTKCLCICTGGIAMSRYIRCWECPLNGSVVYRHIIPSTPP